MTLPVEVQALVDRMRILLGVPACKLTIDMDEAGTVQHVRPELNYRPARKIAVDKLDRASAP